MKVSLQLLLVGFSLVAAHSSSNTRSSHSRQIQEKQPVLSFTDVDNTIIGGSAASVGEFPYFGKFNNAGTCGSVLIHEDILVTAASCVETGGPSSVSIGYTSSSSTGTSISTCGAIAHPGFDSVSLVNDIAIIVLCAPSTAETIPRNTNANYPSTTGQDLTVVGLGAINSGGTTTTTLQKLVVDYVNDADCLGDYNQFDKNQNLCADKASAGICYGDSGNPLIDADGLLVGVASFVLAECASTTYPDFYVDIARFDDWLSEQICTESINPPSDCTDDTTEDPFLEILGILLDLLLAIINLFLGGEVGGAGRR